MFISQSTLSDICYDVAQLCEISYGRATTQSVQYLNEVVQHVQETQDMKLIYTQLDVIKLKFLLFVDSSYSTNKDRSSQLGNFICLVDDDNNFHPTHWSSSKCRHTSTDMLGEETYTLSTGYDYRMRLKLYFKAMIKNISHYILTDSKRLLDTMTASRRLGELRLMSDIAEIRRAYHAEEINNIRFVLLEYN